MHATFPEQLNCCFCVKPSCVTKPDYYVALGVNIAQGDCFNSHQWCLCIVLDYACIDKSHVGATIVWIMCYLGNVLLIFTLSDHVILVVVDCATQKIL